MWLPSPTRQRARKEAIPPIGPVLPSESSAEEDPISFTDATRRRFSVPLHVGLVWRNMEVLIKTVFHRIDGLSELVNELVNNGHSDHVGPEEECILRSL